MPTIEIGETIEAPILLVEDSKGMASLIEHKLQQRWQAEVHVAYSMSEAKEFLKKHRKDYLLAISDLNLPDAPNGEITSLLKRAGVASIVITGSAEEGSEQRIDRQGVFDFIIKKQANAVDYLVEQVGRFHRNKNEKLLVVDDSPSSRELLEAILSNQNYQVLTAEDGVEALEVIKQNDDLKIVITDFTMPNMDGLELTIAIRKSFKKSQLCIIGLSAEDEKSLALEFIRNGANDFLTKPFISEELITRINQNADMTKYISVIKSMAHKDYLTEQYNRRSFFEIAENCLSNEEDDITAVALLDIDHFKKINDNFGHEAGDLVLKVFAKLLEQHFDKSLVARIGGEEFTILFDEPILDVSEKLESFRVLLEQTPINYLNRTINATVSIGLNVKVTNDIDDMLREADELLYAAKAQGRNQVISN